MDISTPVSTVLYTVHYRGPYVGGTYVGGSDVGGSDVGGSDVGGPYVPALYNIAISNYTFFATVRTFFALQDIMHSSMSGLYSTDQVIKFF